MSALHDGSAKYRGVMSALHDGSAKTRHVMSALHDGSAKYRGVMSALHDGSAKTRHVMSALHDSSAKYCRVMSALHDGSARNRRLGEQGKQSLLNKPIFGPHGTSWPVVFGVLEPWRTSFYLGELGEVSKLLLVEQALALVSKYLASKASFMADHTNGGEDTSSNPHWILWKEVFPCSPREWLANKATPPHLGGLMSKYFAH
ncbi:hypothetical protein TIFTF001_009541 [Ficus carica]|uniref:Uncharacterized protein n=1 Tax=Ficus carica TaxID=3494 RepID=A0AA88DHI3_FICCA|nr:hypothetical protein TIFTF001_009541 [Ficus carica]